MLLILTFWVTTQMIYGKSVKGSKQDDMSDKFYS